MSLPKGHLRGAGTKAFENVGALLLGWVRLWHGSVGQCTDAVNATRLLGANSMFGGNNNYAARALLGLMGSNFAAQIWKSNTTVALSKHFALAC